jgi:hypothetical protein
VAVVEGGHAQAGEIHDLNTKLQRNAINQLTGISVAPGTGKQRYGAAHD